MLETTAVKGWGKGVMELALVLHLWQWWCYGADWCHHAACTIIDHGHLSIGEGLDVCM